MNRKSKALFAVAVLIAATQAVCRSGVAQETNSEKPSKIDFNRDIRPILSNKCFACHGPDEEKVKSGLQLNNFKSATSELESGSVAIVPFDADESELLYRVTDEDEPMPPRSFGKSLTDEEINTLKRWIEQGAKYVDHWSYVKPIRPPAPVPDENHTGWPRNDIDKFALREMLRRGYQPAPEADRYALARRVFLDLTGLPPTVEQVDTFVKSDDPQAYQKLVDDLLRSPSFGEHWARKWLDLARYADSAGYADDPPRTIWPYRDWVIEAINQNMPFDQFTIEQMAGDLLPSPTQSQLVATAFHRNTLTNNEGGTQDEEFRNVAVVDRVNTTMAVWMGTTMACAQCHTHKYDPITQEEYFRFFAILNNTEDADRRNEAPIVQLFTEPQVAERRKLEARIAELEKTIGTSTPELVESQQRWESQFVQLSTWHALKPTDVKRVSKGIAHVRNDGAVLIETAANRDTYSANIPFDNPTSKPIAALQLQTMPHESLPGKGSGHGGGNFVITGIRAQVEPRENKSPSARFVRISIAGKDKILSLAEVQVFYQGINIASAGKASQISTDHNGQAKRAIDGNADGTFSSNSVTHTKTTTDPWWELDLVTDQQIDSITIWNRVDNGVHTRLKDFSIVLLDKDRKPVWEKKVAEPPYPSANFAVANIQSIQFESAFADYEQPNFEAMDVLTGKFGANDGWAIGQSQSKPHQLVLIPVEPITIDRGESLRVVIEQNSPHNAILGHFRLATTSDAATVAYARLPKPQRLLLKKPAGKRTETDNEILAVYYRENIAPELSDSRKELVDARNSLASMKHAASVPVMREMPKARETHLQYRGYYLDKGQLVAAGTPAAFHSVTKLNGDKLDRLALAKWLIDENNPLTSRVIVNRYWESLFGRGIVLTSEEFGTQGELPTHPELLDWLATDLIQNGWDTRELIRTIVTSATYRQSALVTPETAKSDPDNRWLARGPRIRMSAEMVRDQALFVSGLLSRKMFGPPVNPPQPKFGLTAAFGGSTDWKTSSGEDRYRRGIYTTWRRSNPYPSMAAFDAPNREVCTVRRNRTNTPLQSLVTLNDPVYFEAAQSLARIALQFDGSLEEQINHGFRRCLLRKPTVNETSVLVELFKDSKSRLSQDETGAMKLSSEPLGPLPEGMDAVDAAAMTVVANILLNMDEIFLKR